MYMFLTSTSQFNPFLPSLFLCCGKWAGKIERFQFVDVRKRQKPGASIVAKSALVPKKTLFESFYIQIFHCNCFLTKFVLLTFVDISVIIIKPKARTPNLCRFGLSVFCSLFPIFSPKEPYLICTIMVLICSKTFL